MKDSSVDFARIESDGMHWIIYRGYAWFRRQLLPKLRLVESSSKAWRPKAAIAWYYLGHLYHCNGAPRAALRAYRRALRCDNELFEARREIGSLLSLLGRHNSAVRTLQRTRELAPLDKIAARDLEYAKQQQLESTKPCIDEASIMVRVAERLARLQPHRALSEVRGVSLAAWQARARAYGALDDSHEAINCWRALVNLGQAFEVSSADIFYLPPSLWESEAFWRLFESGPRNVVGFIVIDPGGPPDIFFGPPELQYAVRPADKSKRLKAMARFQSARIAKDLPGLELLAREYSQWKWPDLTKRFIRQRERSPVWHELWSITVAN